MQSQGKIVSEINFWSFRLLQILYHAHLFDFKMRANVDDKGEHHRHTRTTQIVVQGNTAIEHDVDGFQ